MLRLFALCVALFITSCFFGPNRDPDKVSEVMVTFVTKARSGFWREAMENVTPDERNDMMEDGQVLPEYKEAIGRIRLSTVKNMELGVDSKGRLVGIKDILDESNDMSRGNAETVNIDPSTLEDIASQQRKRLQEEEKLRRERDAAREQEEEDEDEDTFLDKLLDKSMQ